MDRELVEFIKTFGSVWTLDTLLLLRACGKRGLAKNELISRLRGSDVIATKAIDRLVASGLALIDDHERIHYQPGSPKLARVTAAVEIAYRRTPDAVRRLIFQGSSPPPS